MIIGVSKEEEYRATRRPVRPGDYFVCFTDGVDEARDKPAREAGQRYGTRRVENVVARSAGDAPVAQDVAYAIHLDLTDFRAEQLDDACILCFGRRAEQPEQGAHETERLDEPAQ
jgi:serine phosphatase RsbU (regulator of sigma subunit)